MADELRDFGGLIDTRTLAFWLTVDMDGVADLHSEGIGYRQTAEYLRALAVHADKRADERGEQ